MLPLGDCMTTPPPPVHVSTAPSVIQMETLDCSVIVLAIW